MLHAADDEVLAQKLLCCLAQLVSVRKSRNGDPLNIIGSIEKTGYVSSGASFKARPTFRYIYEMLMLMLMVMIMMMMMMPLTITE